MNLQAVVVCDKYDDILARTIRENRAQFDHIVVVTSPEDLRTQHVCEANEVDCLPTDVLNARWGEFCKGCGINAGLERLREVGPVEWVMQLDADIVLPPLARTLLEHAQLDPTMLYGCDRHMLMADDWERHVGEPRLQHENGIYLHVDAFPLGTRIVTLADGYVPIGFFQLWNPAAALVAGVDARRYPEVHNGAGRTDTQFAKLWPSAKRKLLGEFVAYHIETQPAPQGANWDGRTTVRWGETPAALVNQMPGHRKPKRRHPPHHHRHHRGYGEAGGAA